MPEYRLPVMNSVVQMPPHRAAAKVPSGLKMAKTAEDRADIYIYGLIGNDWYGDGTSAKSFADQLKGLGKNIRTIDLRINSEGGDVFAGRSMYTLLTQHQAKVITHVDGFACSAASFVAMAGNEIEIAEGGFMMIHNAWTWARGGAEDLRRSATLLDSINVTLCDTYVARTGRSAAEIKKWMDDETWMNGKECVERSFADRIVENLKVAASVQDPSKFKNIPTALMPRRIAAAKAMAEIKKAAIRR